MFDFLKKNNDKPTFFYSTDVHSHLIPGVDDGSKNVETSISLLKGMHDLGINHFLVTPHVTDGTFMNSHATLDVPFNNLKEAIANENLDITIMHSAEYRVDEFFENKVMKANDYMLLPNNYILIENSFLQESLSFQQIVFDLKTLDFKPILAHPERYYYYITNKDRYRELHDFEILFQINILSFAGYYGKEVKTTAWWLLENDMVNFIGSDLHNAGALEYIKKFLKTKDYKKLSQKANIMNDTAFV